MSTALELFQTWLKLELQQKIYVLLIAPFLPLPIAFALVVPYVAAPALRPRATGNQSVYTAKTIIYYHPLQHIPGQEDVQTIGKGTLSVMIPSVVKISETATISATVRLDDKALLARVPEVNLISSDFKIAQGSNEIESDRFKWTWFASADQTGRRILLMDFDQTYKFDLSEEFAQSNLFFNGKSIRAFVTVVDEIGLEGWQRTALTFIGGSIGFFLSALIIVFFIDRRRARQDQKLWEGLGPFINRMVGFNVVTYDQAKSLMIAWNAAREETDREKVLELIEEMKLAEEIIQEPYFKKLFDDIINMATADEISIDKLLKDWKETVRMEVARRKIERSNTSYKRYPKR